MRRTRRGKARKSGTLLNKIILILSALFVTCFFIVVFACYNIPSLSCLTSSTRKSSVTFESYDGTVISIYGDLFSKVVTLKELPKHVYESVIAIEDRRFYKHFGVDVFGIIRAAFNNIIYKKGVQGGSTLTQQLAKNIFLEPSKSIKRKIQELVLSLMIEHKFSKNQILTVYLNRVYFGAGAYGIDAAAFRYFGKSAKNLNLYESSKLAACLKSPTAYSPINNQEKSNRRAITVLNAMKECGYISASDMEICLKEAGVNYKISEPMSDNRYFTDWIIEHLPNICSYPEDIIVRTTLDTRLQKNAVAIARNAIIKNGFKNNVGQVAIICMDYTGAVRAMVGGHTYSQSQFNRCTANRSVGSAFKFFVYLAALKHGMNPSDKVSDAPINIGGWKPKNYKWQSRGDISLIEAFSYSVNTCAVRVTKKIGIEHIINLAKSLGFTHDISNDLSVALGSGGASILEMASCFGAVMSKGIKVIPYGIINIRTKSGNVIYKAKCNKERVLSEDICAKMQQLMAAVIKNGTGKRADIGIPSYGKSGTSNNSLDACFIGFSYPLVTGVWIGNDDRIPMNKNMTGGKLPAEIWHDFMKSTFFQK